MGHLILDDSELLRVALHGDDEGWGQLHLLCQDKPVAEALIRALAAVSAEHRERAENWREAIGDMHPSLR